jgi:hypothetical protein
MKRLIGVVLCISVLMIACNKKQTETTQEDLTKVMYVNASEGLWVRNSPDINGKKVGLLQNLTQVIITKENINTVNIGGVEGKWVYITEPIEGWVFDGFLKSIYDISGEYNMSPRNTRGEFDLMIDYGSKRLFISTYWVLDALIIDTLELIDNNVYKMTFNGFENTIKEVPFYLIIEILERNKIKIKHVLEKHKKSWFNNYSDELNGVFYKKTDINFYPTHIVIGVERPFNDDEYLDDIILQKYPNIKSEMEDRQGLRDLLIGSVVQLIEIGSTETINGITADWYKVRTNAGTEGWIFSAYLDKFNGK